MDGVVVGDETRLRQIITNLTRYVIAPSNSPCLFIQLSSNACKFTPEGGKLIITTRLILPDVPDGTDPLDVETAMIPRIEKPAIHPDASGDRGKDGDHGKWVPYPTDNQSYESVNDGHPDVLPEEGNDHQVKQPLSTDRLTEHNRRHATSALEYIVVRIEVTDTGFGIKPEDMAESKLFCELQVHCPFAIRSILIQILQPLLIRRSRAANKGAKELAWVLPLFGRLSN